ncbi:YacL family protein [Rheinheimera sp.]|uniref:YacL family protein n=1 Tax=Rheinheimera sp. TaxID=1869214 RepID=UPI00307EA93D
MEYDFLALDEVEAEQQFAQFDRRYNSQSRRYLLRLGNEHLALQQFLLEEFAPTAEAYQSLFQALLALGPYDDYHWQGREYSLTVERQEVQIRHHSLGLETELMEEELGEDQLLLFCECGLEDLLHLLSAWLQFLPQ